jgi:small subunit ribosomal protein S16
MLMIRLRRMGARSNPHYRVVVSDSRSTPTGAAIEELGSYHPGVEGGATSKLALDRERFDHWVKRGARVSPTLAALVRTARKAG